MAEAKVAYSPLASFPQFASPPPPPGNNGSVTIPIGSLPASSSERRRGLSSNPVRMQEGVIARASSSNRVRHIQEFCKRSCGGAAACCCNASCFCVALSCSALLKVTTTVSYFFGALAGGLLGIGAAVASGLTYGCYSACKKGDCCEVFRIGEIAGETCSEYGAAALAYIPFLLWDSCQGLGEALAKDCCHGCHVCTECCLENTSVDQVLEKRPWNSYPEPSRASV